MPKLDLKPFLKQQVINYVSAKFFYSLFYNHLSPFLIFFMMNKLLVIYFYFILGFNDGKLMSDPESLRKLTLTVSSALGEASAAINRMRDSQR